MDGTEKEGTDEQFVEMCKALGHPIRLAIIKFLMSHPSCITGDIVDVLPVAQSTTSQHLKILKAAGWIQGTIEGTATCYCLNREHVRWFKNAVEELL